MQCRSSFERLPVLLATLPLALWGCSDALGVPIEEPDGPSTTVAYGAYSLGDLARRWPGHPCSSGPYRDFDFWVGDWDVFNPSGAQTGTNRVEMLLDGCVIAENWTDASGNRGRSINTYDADTGLWHQTWVSADPLGIIRMAGGIEDGIMDLNGARVSPFGFTIFDRYTWRVLEPGVVEQTGKRTIPALGLDFPQFVGIYRPADDFNPAPEVLKTHCQEGGKSALSREGDVLVGDWIVTAENGLEVGRSHIVSDLSGCLFEERFETAKGLGAVAFLYYDYLSLAWFRTYIDSEGERIELTGGWEDGRLVLIGTEPAPGGREVTVRQTWEPLDGGRLRQRVETSRDGGTTWNPGLSLIFTGEQGDE